MQFILIQQSLKISSQFDLTDIFDVGKVSDIEREHSHEIPAKDISRQALEDISNVSLKATDDVFDVG